MEKFKCAYEGCASQSAGARGWCQSHYSQWLKGGRDGSGMKPLDSNRLKAGRPIVSYVCTAPECSQPTRHYRRTERGLCASHYFQLRTRGQVTATREYLVGGGSGSCTFNGCSGVVKAKFLCNTHFMQLKQTGIVRPVHVATWHLNDQGYMVKGRLLQHRVVMEELIGRKLKSHETVHHKNGNRADNRPENLELWSRHQPSGQRALDKLTWAREIVETYGPIEQILREGGASEVP
jgi:hypothetical protein